MVDGIRADVRPQLPLDIKPFHEWFMPDGSVWTAFYRIGDSYLLRFPGLADFEISFDGKRVQGWRVAGVSEATFQHLYLNQVLPLLLSQQGQLVLHGSAVDIHGKAVAFLGLSGRGKSTLAASFALEGFPFLTDDGLVLEPVTEGYQVLPSHPSIRLWQDSEDLLIGTSVAKVPSVQFSSKARFLADTNMVFCEEPRYLKHVYFLGDGSSHNIVIERLTPAQALIGLVKNSFLLETEEHAALTAHFEQLSNMSETLFFYQLDYPRRFEYLPQLRTAIVEHVL